MKKTGVINQIDELGRILIPDKLLKEFNLKSGNSIEFIIDNGDIILRKKEEASKNIKK